MDPIDCPVGATFDYIEGICINGGKCFPGEGSDLSCDETSDPFIPDTGK